MKIPYFKYHYGKWKIAGYIEEKTTIKSNTNGRNKEQKSDSKL